MKLAYMVVVEVPEDATPDAHQNIIYRAVREGYADEVLVETSFLYTIPVPYVRRPWSARVRANRIRRSASVARRQPDGKVSEQ